MRKAVRKKVDVFEMWCWRRVLRMSWMEKKQCIGARKHHARGDIGIEGGTSSFKILWTFGERGTRNGKTM